MVFSSVLFLFRFLPIFMICYFLVPRKMKNLVLFLGSLIFYAWGEPVYIFLMLFSTISDYVWGRLIEEYRGKDRSRIFLLCSIVINLFILGFFKYADFLMQTVNAVFGTSIPFLNLPLPIGISFYTFQTMSYVIDVYRGDTKAQRNILQFGVYVTMFPQLIAGPILKYHQVERYLQDRRIDLDAISYGAKRFVTGLAKKVLLANNLGLLWKQVTELGTDQMSVLMAWLGIAAFALHTGVAVRRVGCALLVGGQHMGDAVSVFVQLVVEVQHCAAGVAEEGVHPLLTEHLHKDLRTVQLHGEFLLFPFPFSTLHTFFPNTLRDSTRYLINKRSLSPYPRDKDLESIQNSLRYHSR